MFYVSSLLELRERQFIPTLSTLIYKYVYCSTVQMFTRLGSISDTNLTFDITVTTKNVRPNARYKVHAFVLSAFYAVQHSDDFVLQTTVPPAGTHLPGPSDAVYTLTEFTCTQQRTIS